MIKAVLLDLDNTMVLYDELAFYRRYFESITAFFTDLFTPDQFQRRVIAAVSALGRQNGVRSNREIFMERFLSGYPGNADEIWHRFETYYRSELTKITVPVSTPPQLQHTLDRLQTMAVKLVLASNPIFPRTALDVRMAWAGIDPDRFAYVTDMENMSHVKPQQAYYHQVARAIGEVPERCLMVGNDRINDLVAAKAGMKTYRTTEAGDVDYSSLRLAESRPAPPPDIPAPDFTGSFHHIVAAVQRLQQG